MKVIAMGCMSAQMDKEIQEGQRLNTKPVYPQEMDRGDGNDEDAWWKKK